MVGEIQSNPEAQSAGKSLLLAFSILLENGVLGNALGTLIKRRIDEVLSPYPERWRLLLGQGF